MAQAGQSGRSFLEFPTEIRLMIYRLLLCANVLIECGCDDWKPFLNPSILRTCRQILSEARPILYGENTWGIWIEDEMGVESAWFMNTDHFGSDLIYPFDGRVNDLRRFDIRVSVHSKLEDDELEDDESEDGGESLRPAIRKVCKVLSDIPRLDYIRIELDGFWQPKGERPNYSCLREFALLRRVRKVDIAGVQPVYAKILARIMKRQDHIPEMSEALRLLVAPFRLHDDLAQQVNDAVENGNIKRFKELRAQIMDVTDALNDPETPEFEIVAEDESVAEDLGDNGTQDRVSAPCPLSQNIGIL